MDTNSNIILTEPQSSSGQPQPSSEYHVAVKAIICFTQLVYRSKVSRIAISKSRIIYHSLVSGRCVDTRRLRRARKLYCFLVRIREEAAYNYLWMVSSPPRDLSLMIWIIISYSLTPLFLHTTPLRNPVLLFSEFDSWASGLVAF